MVPFKAETADLVLMELAHRFIEIAEAAEKTIA
jgi:hypothetical protein